MDRDAIARGRRREQAVEALAFERDREQALLEQIGSVVLEEEGRRIDEEAFARMAPADVAIVREMLDDGGWALEADGDGNEDADPWLDDDGGGEPAEEVEEVDEIARLESELEGCRVRQRALERYIDALAARPAQP